MSIQAPPQWASASRENGFSYLSWKTKTLLAATVILCGSGLAAQFPNTSAPDESVAASSNFAQPDEGGIPLLSQPQSRYANNAQLAGGSDAPFYVKPGEQIAKYVEPPKMGDEDESEVSSPVPQRFQSRKLTFDPIDDSGLEKKSLDLPLVKWNPRFNQSPPLSERSPQQRFDPAQPETVDTMKIPAESLTGAVIDSSYLLPAEEAEESALTVMIREDSIIPAQNPLSDETIPVISEDQIRPADME